MTFRVLVFLPQSMVSHLLLITIISSTDVLIPLPFDSLSGMLYQLQVQQAAIQAQ